MERPTKGEGDGDGDGDGDGEGEGGMDDRDDDIRYADGCELSRELDWSGAEVGGLTTDIVTISAQKCQSSI